MPVLCFVARGVGVSGDGGLTVSTGIAYIYSRRTGGRNRQSYGSSRGNKSGAAAVVVGRKRERRLSPPCPFCGWGCESPAYKAPTSQLVDWLRLRTVFQFQHK